MCTALITKQDKETAADRIMFTQLNNNNTSNVRYLSKTNTVPLPLETDHILEERASRADRKTVDISSVCYMAQYRSVE